MSEREVRALEEKRIEAIVSRDAQALEDIFDDSILYVHMNGMTENKAQAITGIMTKTQFLSIHREDLKVRIFGGTAILTGRQVAHARRPDGQEVHLNGVAIQVARRMSGGWKFVAWQVTQDAAAPK